MTKPVKRMPTPLGVAPGATASVNLPIGLTYDRLIIRANSAVDTPMAVANWAANLGEIRLLVNGDSRLTVDAADMLKLNAFYGQVDVAGALNIFLARPWMRTIGGEDTTAYGTVGLDTFALEFDIKDAATIRDVEVYAIQSSAKAFGAHRRIQKFTRNQGVTGEAQIADIPRGAYAMFSLHVGTDQIGDAEVVADQKKVIETDKVIRSAMAATAGRTEQAGMTHIDLVSENRVGEAMPMNVSDFRLVLDFEATGNFPIYAESLQGTV